MRVRGTVRPPGDKSISHRALLIGALARGKGSSEFTGLLTGEDVKSTARVLRQLGAKISSIRPVENPGYRLMAQTSKKTVSSSPW